MYTVRMIVTILNLPKVERLFRAGRLNPRVTLRFRRTECRQLRRLQATYGCEESGNSLK